MKKNPFIEASLLLKRLRRERKKGGLDLESFCDELQSEAEKLVRLLKERNYGLNSWLGALNEQVKSLHDLTRRRQ